MPNPTPPTPDLSKLTLSREQRAFTGKKSRKKWWIAIFVAIAASAGLLPLRGGGKMQVESGTVASAFPSQAITVLNATGRVSAQRKAAVSTKATGRLEFLGVQEGSVVKAGQVLAKIESRDLAATEDQAKASLRAAQANLEQGLAEMRDADVGLKRAQDLAAKNFISSSTLDAARARYDKAQASIASLKGMIGVAEANVRAAAVAMEQTL
ncbi:MAG: biotin/lipoyl-binding protein, partial [Betaproteobacteria bacterium]|nr:biotin/lipoyl-binding protein [Betaproteobacteria bacterium]